MLLAPAGTVQGAQQKLDEVESELAELDEKYAEIVKAARRPAIIWLVLGNLFLVGHIGVFAYLTWWELSWDVMEPYSYHVGLFYSWIAWMYFFWTRGGNFELGSFKEYWTEKNKAKKIAQYNFDMERHQRLTQLVERYRRYLGAAPSIRDA